MDNQGKGRPAGRTTVTVSCVGTEDYKTDFTIQCRKQSVKVAAAVRHALNVVYGENLERLDDVLKEIKSEETSE